VRYAKQLPDIWGRQWSIVASPTLSYISVRRSILPLTVFAGGLLFTLLIAAYVHFISKQAITIQRIVVERTNELNEALEQLKIQSHTDGLTNIANRRFMDEYLDNEWLRAIRTKLPITFIIIDVDFFKLYNDNYGHPEGDKCLKKIAAKLKELAHRAGDLSARYGGEEFALILTDTENGQPVADSCRKAIEDLQIPHQFSKIANVITVSVGYCTVIPQRGTDPSMLIAGADKALYRAKEQGRNRVVKVAAE
jgi:diguanylate cyclase (GGDEF)-like protein